MVMGRVLLRRGIESAIDKHELNISTLIIGDIFFIGLCLGHGGRH